jgi:hypothetical protein
MSTTGTNKGLHDSLGTELAKEICGDGPMDVLNVINT